MTESCKIQKSFSVLRALFASEAAAASSGRVAHVYSGKEYLKNRDEELLQQVPAKRVHTVESK